MDATRHGAGERRPAVALVDLMDGGHHAPYAVDLASALEARGYEPILFGPSGLVERVAARRPALRAVHIEHDDRPGALRLLRRFRALRRALSAVRAAGMDQVLFLYLDRWILPLAALRRQLAGLRVVACFHQVYLLDMFDRSAVLRVFRRLEWRAFQALLTDGLRVFLHTERQLLAVRERVSVGWLEQLPYPLEVVDVAIDTTAGAGQLRARFGIPDDARVMLCFGATRREKGADLAVRMLEHLPEDWHLLIAGEARDLDAEALEACLGGADRSRLHLSLERVADDALVPCFRTADLVLLPYARAFAGQSGPLTIAASMGLPVLSSDNEQLAELVERFSLGSSFAGRDPASAATAARALLAEPAPSRRDAFLAEHDPERIADGLARAFEVPAVNEPGAG